MAFISLVKKTGKYRIVFTMNDKTSSFMLATGDKKTAQNICNMVDSLLERKLTGEPNLTLANWLKNIPDDLRRRLERAGLIEAKLRLTIEGASLAYQESKKAVWKKLTKNRRQNEHRWFVGYFGAKTPLENVDRTKAVQYMNWLKEVKGLAPTYINKLMKWGSAVYKYAFLCGAFQSVNPFTGVRVPNVVKRKKQYVTVEYTEKLIQSASSVQWRTLIALLRYAGQRPEEAILSEWSGVDWEAGKFTFKSPKTERHEGKEQRTIPLFPRLREALEEMRMFAEMETGLVLPKYILSSSRSGNGWDSKRKAIADGKSGTMSELTDFIKKAGLVNPGSLPTNMRGSCSTDLKRKYPEHAVDYWLGHSKDVANKHYDVVTEDLFQNASKDGACFADCEKVAGKVAGQVAGFVALQGGFSDSVVLQENAKSLENKGFLQETKKPCNGMQGEKVPSRGFDENVENALFSRGESDSVKVWLQEKLQGCSKIELILSLIDSLDWEEKEQLFERLDSVSR